MADNKWNSLTEQGPYLDFSVNTNPLGLPQVVREHLNELSDIAGAYPDPDCKVLRSRLAEKYHVSSDCILCGNGADDLFYRLVFAAKPHRALIIAPTFEEYAQALNCTGCKIEYYSLKIENKFLLDEAVLSAIQAEHDIVVLCNPNNPTGQLVPPSLLRRILKKCQEQDSLLVVDECFMEFLPNWEEYSLKRCASVDSNLLVIDAFTKTYSLAGFRLGFCICANVALLTAMKRQGQMYNVSVPAQFAGLCALEDEHYREETYAIIPKERAWLFVQLERLGVTIFPSHGNFLLFKTEQDVKPLLLEKGIKVRDCSGFYGLDARYCRIAVRTHAENAVFLEKMKQLKAEGAFAHCRPTPDL